jgi:hypothetical protein
MKNEEQDDPKDTLARNGFRAIDPRGTGDASQLGHQWLDAIHRLLTPSSSPSDDKE